MTSPLKACAELDAAIREAGGARAVVDLQQQRSPRPLDLRRLSKQRAPDRLWFRQDWLAAGATLLAGKGGEGKSSLVIHEAACGALGRPYIGAACTPYSSLVWNCEDDHDDLWRTLERVCEHEEFAMDPLEGRLHLVSRYACENALMTEVNRSLEPTKVFDELREQVNDLQVDVLWLDNIAHAFGGDHDDRTGVTKFINMMNGVVRGRPFGIVLVAHVSRAQGSEFSGSVAWENAARMRWYLGSRPPDRHGDEDETGDAALRFLAKRKSNYSARDCLRMRMQKGLVVPESGAASSPEGGYAAQDEERAERVCLDGFMALRNSGIRTTDGKTSPDFLPSQMVAKNLATSFSKADMTRAMHRLIARGVFSRGAVGHHANRSTRFGLILKEVSS